MCVFTCVFYKLYCSLSIIFMYLFHLKNLIDPVSPPRPHLFLKLTTKRIEADLICACMVSFHLWLPFQKVQAHSMSVLGTTPLTQTQSASATHPLPITGCILHFEHALCSHIVSCLTLNRLWNWRNLLISSCVSKTQTQKPDRVFKHFQLCPYYGHTLNTLSCGVLVPVPCFLSN